MSPVPTRIGSYEVIRLLGKGGMAVVYLARDPAIDRPVAIKLLRDSLDSAELRERFAREARSAGRLRHPNIVTVFQVGEHEDAPYIVMEYVPGETVGEIIKRRATLPVTWKLRVIEDVCRGLAYAHKAQIVHRDMKPANIQIDSDGVVKILDFGIARIGEQRAGEELTRVGSIMGTPNYMAPEQIDPGIADHRSDVFSVGLVLYELLAYRRAFGANSYTVLHNILHDEPVALEQLCPDIDREVVAIVARATRKRPEERYQDFAEMRDELRRVRKRLGGGLEDPIDEASLAIAMQAHTLVVDPARTDVARSLSGARDAYDAGEFEKVLEHCDHVLDVDPANSEAAELQTLARSHLALGRARALLAAGQSAFARGQLDVAGERIREAEMLPLAGDDGATLQAQLSALRRAVTAASERAAAVREGLARAREHLRTGELEAAAETVDECLLRAPAHREALGLRAEIRTAAAEQERARQQLAAEQTVAEARRLAAREEFAAAIVLLEQHQPSHPAVTTALPEILELQAAAERRAADLRRREEYAARADDLLRSARDAVAQRNFSEAIVHLRRIRFGGEDVASVALDRLQPEADALLARSESGVYLATAGDARRAGRFEDARAATELARHRDPTNADVAAMESEIDRAERLRELIDRARDEFHRGAFDEARQSVDDALVEAPDDEEAVGLRSEILAEIEQAQARRRAAEDAIVAAHQLAARGEFTRAIDLLRGHHAYDDVQAALVDISGERARRRAAKDATLAANRYAGQGEFTRALELLRPHERYEDVQAAVARLIDQRAAAEREADERRRREYAAGAHGTVRSARAAADRGKLAEALAQLHAIRFEGADIACPALDMVKAEAEALIARCEAGQHLNDARAALAASELDEARAAVARARERDTNHPGLAAVEAAIADQAVWVERLRVQHEADAAEAAEATLLRTVEFPLRDRAAADRHGTTSTTTAPSEPAPAVPATSVPDPDAGSVPPPTAPSSASAARPLDIDRVNPAPPAASPPVQRQGATPPAAAAAQPSSPLVWRAPIAAIAVIGAAVGIWWMATATRPAEAPPSSTIATAPAPASPSPSPASPAGQPGRGSTPAAPSTSQGATPPAGGGAQPLPAPARGGRQAAPPDSEITPNPTVAPRRPTPSAAPPPAPRVEAPRPSTPAQEDLATPPIAVVPIPSPAVPPQPQPAAPRTSDVIPNRPAATGTPDPTADRPVAPDPAALLAKDLAAIQGMLTQYERAYGQRDAAAVRRIHPSAPASLDEALADARDYSVDVQNPQIAVQGDTATVTATRHIRVQPSAGRVQEVRQPTTFSLRRGPNGWYVDAVR